MFIESSFTLSLSVHAISRLCTYTYAASKKDVKTHFFLFFIYFLSHGACMSVPA